MYHWYVCTNTFRMQVQVSSDCHFFMQGAQEVFKELPHEFVSPDSLEDVVKNGGMPLIFCEHNVVRGFTVYMYIVD